MLVLKRKISESIIINDEITIKIIGIEGETVKLGIIAPRDIQIFREELYNSIKSENKGSVLKDVELNLSDLEYLLEMSSKKDD